MSHVNLIAADKELPLRDHQEFRESIITVPGDEPITIGFTCGFMVAPHEYYRYAVDELGIEMKPFQYEMDFQVCQTDLDHLLAYLRENFSPGEEVELYSLWVGSGAGGTRHYRGKLSEFDLDTLGMLYELECEPDLTGEFDDLICQVCLTVEI